MDKRSMMDARSDQSYQEKYSGLNLAPILRGVRPTVEFRLFSPTLNPRKIASYIQIAIGIVEWAVRLQKRVSKWDARAASANYPGLCQPEREVNRMLTKLGWIGGSRHGAAGIISESAGLPTRQAMVREMRRLAQKYAGLTAADIARLRGSAEGGVAAADPFGRPLRVTSRPR